MFELGVLSTQVTTFYYKIGVGLGDKRSKLITDKIKEGT